MERIEGKNKQYFIDYFNKYYNKLEQYARILASRNFNDPLLIEDKASEILSDTYEDFNHQLSRGFILNTLPDNKIYKYLTTLMYRQYQRPIDNKYYDKNRIPILENSSKIYNPIDNVDRKLDRITYDKYVSKYITISNKLGKTKNKILKMLIRGYTFKEIQQKLNISENTLRGFYAWSIKSKVNSGR
jgi:hypothetical protein